MVRDAISLGPQWTCQSSTLAIGVCGWQLPCFDIAFADAGNMRKVFGKCQSLQVCLELRSNATLPKVDKNKLESSWSLFSKRVSSVASAQTLQRKETCMLE